MGNCLSVSVIAGGDFERLAAKRCVCHALSIYRCDMHGLALHERRHASTIQWFWPLPESKHSPRRPIIAAVRRIDLASYGLWIGLFRCAICRICFVYWVTACDEIEEEFCGCDWYLNVRSIDWLAWLVWLVFGYLAECYRLVSHFLRVSSR